MIRGDNHLKNIVGFGNTVEKIEACAGHQ